MTMTWDEICRRARADRGPAPSVGLAPRWIPVSERLPRELERVLIAVGNYVEVASIHGDWWIVESIAGPDVPLSSIVHWMPLPEPPKEAC